MTQIVDHLAELTGFRDRDVLDTTLVGALRDLLRPLSVTISHCVGDDSRRRWLVRARLTQADVAAQADSAWVDLDDLPAFDDFPHRRACMQQLEPVEVPGAEHLTVYPLITDNGAIGVLEIASTGDLDAQQLMMVSSLLRIYRNMQGLLDYSERDMLTGLLNRKTFDDSFYKATAPVVLQAALTDARRSAAVQQATYLGVIDIDHFKKVNDNFGHLIGDEVLLLMSRLMRASFRFHDRLYRFGGEEFVVLLRCAGDAQAQRALERLRANTQAYAFPQVGRVTVSVGFTCVRAGDSPSSAFARADKAIYWAKGNGRNRVADFAELVAGGALSETDRSGEIELF
jgi:diguanylate cyclase (GGDEF)-like protein